MTAAELAAVGVQPASPRRCTWISRRRVMPSVQKVEGLALLEIRPARACSTTTTSASRRSSIDNATGTFTLAPGYMPEAVTLGIINVPGLDASDRDTRDQHPRLAGVRHVRAGRDRVVSARRAARYLVTANEGDARDWPGFVGRSARRAR